MVDVDAGVERADDDPLAGQAVGVRRRGVDALEIPLGIGREVGLRRLLAGLGADTGFHVGGKVREDRFGSADRVFERCKLVAESARIVERVRGRFHCLSDAGRRLHDRLRGLVAVHDDRVLNPER
jgi:hypothetical protein